MRHHGLVQGHCLAQGVRRLCGRIEGGKKRVAVLGGEGRAFMLGGRALGSIQGRVDNER